MIGGCALNHGLKKVRARGKGPCAKVWDIRAQWLCMVRDTADLAQILQQQSLQHFVWTPAQGSAS